MDDFRGTTQFCESSLVYANRSAIKVVNITLKSFGTEVLKNATLDLKCKRRYGIVGLNGCGKTSLLLALASRQIFLPDYINICHGTREVPASTITVLQCVTGPGNNNNEDEMEAVRILRGLGFNKAMRLMECREFSSDWRKRIGLARALFIKPHLLLLDEPIANLDVCSFCGAEGVLRWFRGIVILVSNSQDFLNNVCTHIIHMTMNRLNLYPGNFEAFIEARSNKFAETYKKHKQNLVVRRLLRLGCVPLKPVNRKLQEKIWRKMVAVGLIEKKEVQTTPPPAVLVQKVYFRYNDDAPWVFRDIDFRIGFSARLAIVGPNNQGKSTLLKLLYGTLKPTSGKVCKLSKLRFGYYHPDLIKQLPLDLSSLDYMMLMFPGAKVDTEMSKFIEGYGLKGRLQWCPMGELTEGQRCRVIIARLAHQAPHFLLLDQPTNYLDIKSVRYLADFLDTFLGGVVFVTNDIYFINRVAQMIWICENQDIILWDNSAGSYKRKCKEQLTAQEEGHEGGGDGDDSIS